MDRKFKKVGLGLLGHVTPSIYFGRILRSEVLVYKSYLFLEQPFYRNYLTLDSHTNTVITHLPSCQDGIENRDKVLVQVPDGHCLYLLSFRKSAQ